MEHLTDPEHTLSLSHNKEKREMRIPFPYAMLSWACVLNHPCLCLWGSAFLSSYLCKGVHNTSRSELMAIIFETTVHPLVYLRMGNKNSPLLVPCSMQQALLAVLVLRRLPFPLYIQF